MIYTDNIGILDALKMAEESFQFRVRMGSVITDLKGKVISKGFNIRKTHPFQQHYANKMKNKEKEFLHAEMSALVKCRKSPHTLYVARLKKDGSIGNAKPCPICLNAIQESGLKRIVYTNDDSSISFMNIEGVTLHDKKIWY